ncbi:hypothetical protein D1007_60315 [Hordeum vulgare]|uniref:Predicted protein n=1 Tax=Hordeum vulgare subsp. vulgare TaxID=112509 RepID=F2E9L3_HORVV|nr:uncharacterized protein LOC123413554 [Hordeum vulgare subsp. vulgare]KAE8768236.1 hypothetical protein D1007_60315 [Hordeum vulgare]BAK04035.1 predicted protein [Hordeum vulgare subsp. vulgare]BAK04848.1 predicted protein [Hordeum vulgare subsp. vulgare]
MEKTVALALLLLFTLLIPTHRFAEGQANCRSQISLANEACSLRNFPGSRPYVPRQLLNETSTSTTPGSKDYELRARHHDDDDDDEEGGEHEGRHRRRQRHRHSADNGEMDPYDTACCRRLMATDNSCICQASARLPVFMVSVRHVIKLTPVEGCEVNFECPATLSPLG